MICRLLPLAMVTVMVMELAERLIVVELEENPDLALQLMYQRLSSPRCRWVQEMPQMRDREEREGLSHTTSPTRDPTHVLTRKVSVFTVWIRKIVIRLSGPRFYYIY